MPEVFAVETIQNDERSDFNLFSTFSQALDNVQFVRDTGEDDSVNVYRINSSLSPDLITEHVQDFGFGIWKLVGSITIKEPARYTSTYWQHEADLPQGREGVYFLQILDPEGEEYAVIIHQTWDGMYPIGGKMANEKLERANHICEALNAAL